MNVTLFVFLFSQNNIRENEKEIFSYQSEEIKNFILEKMNASINVLS